MVETINNSDYNKFQVIPKEAITIPVFTRSQFHLEDGVTCPQCSYEVNPVAMTREGSFVMQCGTCRLIFMVK